MLFPFRTRSIFRSRWIALLWAGGIVWSAIEFAGGQNHDDAAGNSAMPANMSGTDADAAEMKRAAQLLDQFGR